MIRTISRILKAFADNGLFDEGVALVGSWCFWTYPRIIMARLDRFLGSPLAHSPGLSQA